MTLAEKYEILLTMVERIAFSEGEYCADLQQEWQHEALTALKKVE